MRKLAGTVAGVVVAMIVITLVQMVGHRLYGAPPGDSAALAGYVETMPLGASGLVLLSYLLGALAGALVALRITRWAPSVWIVAAVILAADMINIALIPHPWWMIVGSIAAPLLGVWLALRVGRSARA